MRNRSWHPWEAGNWRRGGRTLGLLAGIAGLGSALAFGEGEAKHPRVHRDGSALEEAVVEANREFLREHSLLARAALDRAAEACRVVSSDEGGPYPSELVNFDRAFHLTLDKAREYATAGRIDDAFNQLVWVQRSCLSCHRMAREAGITVVLPETPPVGESDGSASPVPGR